MQKLATFVPTGRTLAEIINLPAKIFTVLIQLSGTMETTENGPTQKMRNVYAKTLAKMEAADAEYETNIKTAEEKYDALMR